MGEDIKQAVDARRIHHQLLPDQLRVEQGVSPVRQAIGTTDRPPWMKEDVAIYVGYRCDSFSTGNALL